MRQCCWYYCFWLAPKIYLCIYFIRYRICDIIKRSFDQTRVINKNNNIKRETRNRKECNKHGWLGSNVETCRVDHPRLEHRQVPIPSTYISGQWLIHCSNFCPSFVLLSYFFCTSERDSTWVGKWQWSGINYIQVICCR